VSALEPGPPPPIVLAAVGPQMIALTAEIADGWFPWGFAPGMMGPTYTGSDTVSESLGFTGYAAASLEAQFPIPMLPETYGLSGAVWADAAYISGQSTPLAADPGSFEQPFKSSVGASIIWDSPFGPLRGDFALPLTYSDNEKAHLQYFAFTINQLL